MPQRSVTVETLGAWVIKCNPQATALEPMRAAGRAKSEWCVADNYRSRLMLAGQRVLFWVSGHPRRGIWGAGTVTGTAVARDGRWHVPVDIPLFDEPLTATELASIPGLRDMEVFRSPQQSNPSWISAAHFALVEPLLPSAD